MLQRLLSSLLGGAAKGTLLMVTGGHQDGVVHGSAQLDGADDDAGNERQLGAGKVRDAHVDGNGGLDAGNQQHGDGNALEGDGDDDQNRQDGPDVDVLEVHVSHLDQVLGHGTLAGNNALRVHRLDQADHLVQLAVDGIGAGLVGAVGQNQLVAAGLQDLHHAVRHQRGVEAGAGDGIQAHHLGDAVHVVDLVAQVAHLGGGQVIVHQDKVAGGHAEVLTQLVGAHDAGQVLGQRIEQGVVHFGLTLGHDKGDQDQDKDCYDRSRVGRYKVAELGELGDDGAVLVLFHQPVKGKDQSRQDHHRADDAQRHALGHDDADVAAQGQAHGAQRQEAGDGGQAGSGNGGHGLADGTDHGFFIIRAQLLFLLVAVQQEDGEVHRNAQLQHGGQCFGDVADLAQEDVGAEVVRDGEQQAQHEQQRGDGAFQREEQHQQAGTYGDQDVERHFLVDQCFGVLQDDAHAAKEAILPQQRFDLFDGVHRLVAGTGSVEADDEHGGIVLAEHELLHVGGQHLGGDAGIDHIAEPEGLHDTGHGLDVLLHGNEFVGRQAFHRDHAGGRQMEVILEGYLADHGVQILRQVGEDVIVDAGGNCADRGRNQQQERYCQDQLPEAHNALCDLFHEYPPESEMDKNLSKMTSGHFQANTIITRTNRVSSTKMTKSQFFYHRPAIV